jgi:hypothetical protein
MFALRPSTSLPPRRALFGSVALACLALATGCGDNLSVLPDGSDGSRLGDAPLACLPNLDGRIDASELAPVLGVAASYRVSPPGESRAVDVVGTVDAQGVRRWRFDAAAPSDRTVALTASSLEGRWFASSFPHASFVAPLDAEVTLLGVYSHDADALWLHGLASSEENPKAGKTLLVYDAPLAVYRFPLAVGASYTSKGHVTGGTLRFHDLARPIEQADLQLLLAGSLPDLMMVLRHPRLHLFDRRPLELVVAEGSPVDDLLVGDPHGVG